LVNLSTRHFHRGFVASFGRGPHDYILGRKMALARLLMRTTTLPLGQVAMECGMADQAHFCRSFPRIVGDRPSVWRKNGVSFYPGTTAQLRSTPALIP
jgi:AraC family transcriptional regulator